MSDSVRVRRVRVSRVAGHIHNALRTIGSPSEFERQLANPRTVCGLPVSLPFAPNTPVDKEFWETVVDGSLTIPIQNPGKAASRAVPLRLQARLDAPAEIPRLEVHIHPFAITAAATVDLKWPDAVGIDEVLNCVQDLEEKQVSVSVGDAVRPTVFRQAAVAASEQVGALLADKQYDISWDAPQHRLVTVIDGDFDVRPTAMPDPASALCLTLHYLAGGQEALPDPRNAFVAQWNNATFNWPPSSLVYTLDSGTSVLVAKVGAHIATNNSDRHRRYLLTLAYLTALSGLVDVCANQNPESMYFGAWGKMAAGRLGQMFGPAGQFRELAQLPQAFLSRNGSSDAVELIIGKPLEVNSQLVVEPWPG